MTSNLVVIEEARLKQMLNSLFEAYLNNVSTTTNTPSEDHYLSRKEVSAFIGVSLPTLDRYRRDGRINGYPFGGTVRFKKSEIIEAVESGMLKYKRR